MEKKIELSDQDLHCIARMIQTLIVRENEAFVFGCIYCKYYNKCYLSTPKRVHFYDLIRMIGEESGVDTTLIIPEKNEGLKYKLFPGSWVELEPERFSELLTTAELEKKDWKKVALPHKWMYLTQEDVEKIRLKQAEMNLEKVKREIKKYHEPANT